MTEFWEHNFQDKKKMWGEAPALSASLARDYFLTFGVQTVLIPGIGYGRNAKPFIDAGMVVTGIEISQTAIDIAKSEMGLSNKIYHGSASDMPFDQEKYDSVFCYALIHLLSAEKREKLIKDCYEQLSPGGVMAFTVISKEAPSYGRGVEIGTDRFEMHGGVQMFFYDESSIREEFSQYGLVEYKKIEELSGKDSNITLPFYIIFCRKEE